MIASAVTVKGLQQKFLDPHGQVLLDLQIEDFQLPAAAQCAVSGASGVGKTTFMNLLAGLLPVQQGQLTIAGEKLAGAGEADRDAIRGRHIGMVFQRFHLLTGFSALENVVIAQNCAGAHDPAFACELLERLGLTSHRDQPPHRLSAGQQQRLALARALANRPGWCWPMSPRETWIRRPRPRPSRPCAKSAGSTRRP
jgi:putative ABC transport system ATP-binding protein